MFIFVILNNESIEFHEEYLGQRKHRGLFVSSEGKLINADINAAGNIFRKNVVSNVEQLTKEIVSLMISPEKFHIFQN